MSYPSVLLTQELAPQTVPVSELPMKVYEPAFNTGLDSSSGLTTAGFRTAKYLLEEWNQHNYTRYYEAFADRDHSEWLRQESQSLAAYTGKLAERTQQDSTAKVGKRLQDIHFWKSELQREIEDLVTETDLQVAQKQRLERALDATKVLYSLAMDNLQCREWRQHPDLVRDQVEAELLKENTPRNVQHIKKRKMTKGKMEIRLNRDHKEVCEMDWSDKLETYNIDEKCGRYNNQSTNIRFHPSSSKLEDSASTSETWAKHSHDNIYRAKREKLASVNLRALIDNILHDIAEDLHTQSDLVNQAFAKHCEILEDTKHKLEHHLKKRGGGQMVLAPKRTVAVGPSRPGVDGAAGGGLHFTLSPSLDVTGRGGWSWRRGGVHGGGVYRALSLPDYYVGGAQWRLGGREALPRQQMELRAKRIRKKTADLEEILLRLREQQTLRKRQRHEATRRETTRDLRGIARPCAPARRGKEIPEDSRSAARAETTRDLERE
ncbi:tektin-4-like [Anolis sagrei]|uniref:tektin-4-like n=1 Tax=Anolis sagrei TaxID=38937 RepID=UPI0035219CA1